MKSMSEQQKTTFGNSPSQGGAEVCRGEIVNITSGDDAVSGPYVLIRKDEEIGCWELCKFSHFRTGRQSCSIFWGPDDGRMSVSGGPWLRHKGPFTPSATGNLKPVKAWNWMGQTPGEQKGSTFEYGARIWFASEEDIMTEEEETKERQECQTSQ